MELLHDLQLEISGAEISFAAPLSFDAMIKEGDLHMSDMFTLYKYENMLYTMAMTGREIKDYLEMSYSLWTDVMKSADDNLLLFADAKKGGAKGDYAKLLNPSYNFDSAAGINYTVDVTRRRERKSISSPWQTALHLTLTGLIRWRSIPIAATAEVICLQKAQEYPTKI